MRWVVVGAGSGGCVAASRLSEDPHRQVLLVEAGPDLDRSAVPVELGAADFFAALRSPGRVHDGLVVSRAGHPAPSPYRRGRGVGGSSVVNAMIALRGDPARYRRWGWDDVDAAWARVAIPEETPEPAELGAVDRALLAADPAARPVPLTRRQGRRVSAAEAYLWPAAGRPNLAVRPDTSVAEVVLDGDRAVGVRLAGGEVVDADAVVLAAGAIHTPALLQRSGLRGGGIGDGLQDHPAAPLTLALEEGAWVERTLVTGTVLERGDLQVLPLNHLGSDPEVRGLGVLMVALMRPRGPGGRVRDVGGDADAHPTVTLDLLADPGDVARLVAGVRMALELVRRPSFRSIVREVYVDAHGTTAAALADDRAIERWLRTTAGEYLHASCTCAMGRVVDADGLVRGRAGLYVCDASVFPEIPDVNTHLPTTMLAERLAARWDRRER